MRVTLTNLEVAALISACTTELVALELRINSARKLNNLSDASDSGLAYADLSTAQRKLHGALVASTQGTMK